MRTDREKKNHQLHLTWDFEPLQLTTLSWSASAFRWSRWCLWWHIWMNKWLIWAQSRRRIAGRNYFISYVICAILYPLSTTDTTNQPSYHFQKQKQTPQAWCTKRGAEVQFKLSSNAFSGTMESMNTESNLAFSSAKNLNLGLNLGLVLQSSGSNFGSGLNFSNTNYTGGKEGWFHPS